MVMNESDWLKSLKVGDEVAIVTGSWTHSYQFVPVARVTATQIVAGSRRFNRRTGLEVGQGYYGSSLTQPTPELKTEVKQRARSSELLSRINKITWRHLPLETLEKVVKALETSAGRGDSVDTPPSSLQHEPKGDL